MQSGVSAVLALAEIKAALHEFETGEVNATDVVARIAEACRAALHPQPTKTERA